MVAETSESEGLLCQVEESVKFNFSTSVTWRGARAGACQRHRRALVMGGSLSSSRPCLNMVVTVGGGWGGGLMLVLPALAVDITAAFVARATVWRRRACTAP